MEMSAFQSDSPERERRMVQRYTVVAVSEIADPASAVRLSGRVVEVSRNGCFVHTSITPSSGTTLDMKICCDKGTFATKGKVIYVQERLGFGVTFLNPPEDQLRILDSWLAQLSSATVEKTDG
jgi:hypothetical protein